MKKLVFIAFLALGSLLACTKGAKETSEKSLPLNLVDRIELVDLNGKAIPLESFKGKTVFINYWATWCRPCVAEMPSIDEAAKILADEDFVFLAASDEEIEKIGMFTTEYAYSFQFVHSKTSVFNLDIMALPTTIIINKAGKIVYNEVGAMNWASSEALQILRNVSEK